MSKLFNKFLAKLLAVIVIILFIVAFREAILTDSNISEAFGELMGLLPFAEVISNAVCTVLKCQYEVPVVSTTSVLTDLIRLAFMACFQPIIVGFLTAIFLPLPKTRDYRTREDYMDSLGYRAKELVVTVLSAPLLAALAAWLSSALFGFFLDTFGAIISVILGILVVLGLGAVSLVPLLIGGLTFGTAIVWRLAVTFGAKMVTTFITNAFCIGVYVAFIGGVQGKIATSIVALIIWLIVMDLGVNCLQRAVLR